MPSVLDSQEELAGQKFNDLYEYYRSMYSRVTEDDIDKFQESYRHSEEESASLESLYERFKGNMHMYGRSKLSHITDSAFQ